MKDLFNHCDLIHSLLHFFPLSRVIMEITTVGLITASSLFYTLIWTHPVFWIQLCTKLKRDSVETMAYSAQFLRATQILLCTALFLIQENDIQYSRWLPSLLLVILGQALNFRTYYLLGQAGVYYGFKLGHKVPWVNRFPYNFIRDPQYVGCLSTLLGSYYFGVVSEPIWLCWSLNYFYLMVLEGGGAYM